MTPENVYVRPNGARRECRICKAQRSRDGHAGGGWVPAEPFRLWLLTHHPLDISFNDWEQRLGCGAESLRKVANGHRQFVLLDFVDRVLCASGAHLNDVYPYEEPT